MSVDRLTDSARQDSAESTSDVLQFPRYKSRGNADDSTEPDDLGAPQAWPKMADAAMHGIAGDIARLATANSEADPVAVLATVLAYAGAEFGRGQFVPIGDSIHHSRHFHALVGQSSRARKGTSFGPVERIFRRAEAIRTEPSTLPFPVDSKLKISHGPLSTGEGLIFAVRDGEEGVGDKEDADPGVRDKRLLVVEQELGSALRAFQRQGNNLSMVLRMAFDGGVIAPLTKHSRTIATDPHINVLAHITRQELANLLAATEVWNGLGNRFLWLLVRRTKLIAFPTPMPADRVEAVAKGLARVVGLALDRTQAASREMPMSVTAQACWRDAYSAVAADRAGMLGAITSRQEVHARRLALTYALLDGVECIERVHLEAAFAFCDYALHSARYIFGEERQPDPIAQKILAALAQGPKTQSEIHNIFGGHKAAQDLNAVLTDFQERGLITLAEEKTPGRPRKVWKLVERNANP